MSALPTPDVEPVTDVDRNRATTSDLDPDRMMQSERIFAADPGLTHRFLRERRSQSEDVLLVISLEVADHRDNPVPIGAEGVLDVIHERTRLERSEGTVTRHGAIDARVVDILRHDRELERIARVIPGQVTLVPDVGILRIRKPFEVLVDEVDVRELGATSLEVLQAGGCSRSGAQGPDERLSRSRSDSRSTDHRPSPKRTRRLRSRRAPGYRAR